MNIWRPENKRNVIICPEAKKQTNKHKQQVHRTKAAGFNFQLIMLIISAAQGANWKSANFPTDRKWEPCSRPCCHRFNLWFRQKCILKICHFVSILLQICTWTKKKKKKPHHLHRINISNKTVGRKRPSIFQIFDSFYFYYSLPENITGSIWHQSLVKTESKRTKWMKFCSSVLPLRMT